MLSVEQFFEVKRKEVEQGSEKHEVQAVDVAMDRSNYQSEELFPERRAVIVTVSTISSETCCEAGDNKMNFSTGNKTTTLINLNDVPHNVGKGFLQAPTSRKTITTTTTITPHVSIMYPISRSVSVCT
ncbi:hypothetical protein RDI58_015016 [Solanum bulbocastanum]|uniref:Uncharacterized protein n=1 Tax=Solanum bulbocastanum TaxID=147425 RepID=A0AAN8YCG5_SOLBU